MKKNRFDLSWLVAILTPLLWVDGAQASNDDNDPANSRPLVGVYGMTTSQNCIRTPFVTPPTRGFDDSAKSLLLQGEPVSAIGSGVMQFKRDGTVTISEGRFTEILYGKLEPSEVPVNALTSYSCAGTYARLPARKINIALECSVASPAPGLTVTIKPFNFEGYVGRDLQTLQLNLIEGAVQKIEVSAGGRIVQQRERICVQNASLSRL